MKTKNRHNDREPAHVPHDVPRGVMFPIQQMPWFMQDLSKLIPLTYAADAMRKIMLLNASVADVSTDILILVALGIVTMAIALPLFRRSMTR